MVPSTAASLVIKDDHSVPVGSKSLDLGALSRQIAFFDVHSQLRFSGASVYISGLNLFALEVAKNVCLSGPKSITIHDDRPATVRNAALVPMHPKCIG
jgi:molybdopterin/thiamine biosynthesis adenylyltransferase